MKMVKKILLGLTAAAAIGFVGCKQVDDPKEAITGSNNDYSVDYENTDGENYRAYKSTGMNHAGALVKVKFDNKDVGSSKMGVIFDLHDNADDKEAKDFYIIGLGTTASSNIYVSKFENVTDLQADNFGTKLTTNPAHEDELVKLGSKSITVPTALDGSVTYYVCFKANKDGEYDWAVLNLTETEANALNINDDDLESKIPGSSVLAHGTIENAFDAVDSVNKIPQNKLAVYAMITPNQTLKGSWKYLGMYKEAEEIAE